MSPSFFGKFVFQPIVLKIIVKKTLYIYIYIYIHDVMDFIENHFILSIIVFKYYFNKL